MQLLDRMKAACRAELTSGSLEMPRFKVVSETVVSILWLFHLVGSSRGCEISRMVECGKWPCRSIDVQIHVYGYMYTCIYLVQVESRI